MKLLIVSVLVIVIAIAGVMMFTNVDEMASDTISSVKVTNPLQTYEINTEEELLCHAGYTDFLGNFNKKIYALGSEGMKQKYPSTYETFEKISGGKYSTSTQQDEEIARELLEELFMNEMSIHPALKSSLNYIFTDSFTPRYVKISQLSPGDNKCYSILNLEIPNKPEIPVDIVEPKVPKIPEVYYSPVTYTVKIPKGTGVPGCEKSKICYSPNLERIKVGDIVSWINDDSVAHTVTSGSPADGSTGVFDSSLVMADATYAFTFNTAGSYDYFCMVHPWMIGIIQVS